MNERFLIIGIALSALVALLVLPRLRTRAPTQPLSEWFTVTFDEANVVLSAHPPGGEPWKHSFQWSEVTRVCFKSEGILASDGVYIFTRQRPASYVVPTEASGGGAFWSHLVERGLFPADLAVKVATQPEGSLSCWPPKEVGA